MAGKFREHRLPQDWAKPNVRMPRELVEALKQLALQRKTSLNTYVVEVLAKHVEDRRAVVSEKG